MQNGNLIRATKFVHQCKIFPQRRRPNHVFIGYMTVALMEKLVCYVNESITKLN